tara:strand:+ start:1432 stop:1710 length:279 start_codon:yes stop_codon:yes gene_type:complete
MFVRINTFKYASKMQADATRALIKYEVIKNLEGIVSIEVIDVTETHLIGIFRYESEEAAKKGYKVYVENLKKEANLKFESIEGARAFYIEKS